MVEHEFEVPSEVPRLIELAAELARAQGRTGAAERRFLEEIFVACATSDPGARATLSVRDDPPSLRVVLDGGDEPSVIDAPRALRGEAVDEPGSGAQTWVYDFAQQTVRHLAELRRELEETNHGVVALYSEIDTRRAAEETLRSELEERAARLLAVDKRKDEFIAMLGHELRNPIATIEGGVQTLRDLPAVMGEPRARQVLDVLDRQGRNVKRMLGDLLNVSRIKRGKVQLSRRPTELRALVEACADDVRTRAEACEHRLRVELPPDDLWVSADPARLTQVLTNLLDNAIKYTPSGGVITLYLDRDADSAVVTVRDTGVGIANERIRSVFEAFVQFDVALDRAAGGMGLGLSVVKALVELHGGEVRVHSPGRDQGSSFEVRLPLSEVQHAPSPAPEASPSRDASGAERTLLLVEDNTDLRELTAHRLSRRGFRVLEACSGNEALELAQREPPDVLVTDIGLPGQDGFALAAAMAERLGDRLCVFVALSGYGEPREPERRALFDAYLVKPLDVAALLEVVGNRLG